MKTEAIKTKPNKKTVPTTVCPCCDGSGRIPKLKISTWTWTPKGARKKKRSAAKSFITVLTIKATTPALKKDKNPREPKTRKADRRQPHRLSR